MSTPTPYQPPYTLTPAILRLVAKIAEAIGRLSTQGETTKALRLKRINRIRTIQGSLAIEGNTLSEEQITAILDGKRVVAPPREIQEARNAIAAYDRFEQWQPQVEGELPDAHRILMTGLLKEAGAYRCGGVGVMSDGGQVIHMAPPADRVPFLMQDLQSSTDQTDSAPFIEFMLRMILDAVSSAAAPQVTPQVERLLQTLIGEMSREELQIMLSLQDRKSFRARYLMAALAEGLIEMTLPAKPNSRLQKYRLTDKGRRWRQRRDEE